jgi:hypothetical protein
MIGFKKFVNAAITISGNELVDKIRKSQFDVSGIALDDGARVADLWKIVLSV